MLKREFFANKTPIIFLVSTVLIAALATGELFAKEKKNITLILWRGHTKAEDGFQRVVNEVYEVNWTELDAGQSKEKLDEILKSIDLTKTNLVYTYGTTVTDAAKKVIKDVPVIFNAIFDPVRLGIVDSWERSGCNFVGGSLKVQAAGQINTLKKLLDFKRLGVIYNPHEKNSLLSLQEFEALQSNFGYVAVPVVFSFPGDLESAKQGLDEGKVDAVICTVASMITTNSEAIANALIERKLPSLASVVEMADKGILLGLGVNFETLGEEVGRIALRVLRGESPNNFPIVTLQKYDVILNSKTADRMGLKIPMSFLKIVTKVIK